MSDRERSKCDLLKRIDQAIKHNGADSIFCFALRHHLKVLRDSKPEEDMETRMEMCQYLLSKMFLDKMDLYPSQPFECNLTENSAWPLMPVPAECFGDDKQTDEDRRKWFFDSLKIKDVLDCRVSSVLPNSFQLRVLHKYNVSKLLDDLQIMVVLHCFKNEIRVLEQKPLLVTEFVRVAVIKIDKADDQIKVTVTVDKDTIIATNEFCPPLPKLGRISKDDFPAYVFDPPDTEKLLSYSDYLNSKPQFQNPHFHDNLLSKCGIDPKMTCSFFPEYNCKEYPEEQTGQVLLKESKLADVKQIANEALKELKDKKYDKSLELINRALDICPKDDPLVSTLYEYRAAIPLGSLKSLCDYELAFRLAPEDANIRQTFIHKIFKVANFNYRSKQYKKAVFGFEEILKRDPNHRLAAKGLNLIKTRHPDQLINFEEKSLTDLQEKKFELISELKKCA